MTERIDQIYQLVNQHKYITPSLVAQAMFRFPSGRNKAQQLMGRMARGDRTLNRFRVGRSEYVYHLGLRSKKWRHWLDLTRFHFALLNELKPWQKIIFWQHEVKYSFGIADGFYIVKLTIDGAGLMFFLEYDDGNNSFDKVQKYISYYNGKTWRGEWWGDSFPLVLVVTPRAEEIRLMVERSGDKAGEIFRVIRGLDGGILDALRRGH